MYFRSFLKCLCHAGNRWDAVPSPKKWKEHSFVLTGTELYGTKRKRYIILCFGRVGKCVYYICIIMGKTPRLRGNPSIDVRWNVEAQCFTLNSSETSWGGGSNLSQWYYLFVHLIHFYAFICRSGLLLFCFWVKNIKDFLICWLPIYFWLKWVFYKKNFFRIFAVIFHFWMYGRISHFG